MNNYPTQITELKSMIANSFQTTRQTDVKSIRDLDLFEVAYKVILQLEAAFGKTPPEQKKQTHTFWYSLSPMTNLACSIGKSVLIEIQQDDEDITKRNIKRFKVGYHLLTVLFGPRILEIPKRAEKSRDKFKLRVSKGMEDTFEDLVSIVNVIDVNIPVYTRPQFEAPIPFTRYYHPVAGPMVRNVNPEAVKHFRTEVCPKVFDAINKHMEIAYNINQPILDVYMNSLEDDVFTFNDKDLDEEQLFGKEWERDKVLELAKFVGDRTFWQYMFYDSRSRLYSSTSYLSHAGCKLSKSLFLYNEKKPITKEGWFWLMVHTANCFGYDKDSIDGRFNFAEEHLEEWVEIGADPVNNKLWQKAGSPFEFLSAVVELHNAVSSGDRYNYESGLAVAWDASCSGLQVLAALANDETSGALCNLTDTEERGDYYLTIADKVWEDCVYDDQEEKMFKQIAKDLASLDEKVERAFVSKNKEAIKKALEERSEYSTIHKANIYSASKVFWGQPEMVKLRRQICKRPCMTYFYSCGAQTMSKAMFSDHSADEEFKGLNSSYCFWLAKRIYEVCKETMPVPTALMDLFIKLGEDDYKKGKDFSVVAPFTKFYMMQYYRKDVTKIVKVKYHGKELQPRVNVAKREKINRSKVLSATSPNIVHMLDAQIVAGIILNSEYALSSIHDSFSTHANDAGRLYEDCRNVFVDIFSKDILMDILEQKDSVNYYKSIPAGNLDLNEAIDNEHCFS